MTDLVFAVVLFVLPILNLIFHFRQVHSFFDARNNTRVLKKICCENFEGSFSIKRPAVFQRILEKSNIPGHQRAEFMKHYRKLYRSAFTYCVGTFISAALLILYLFLSIFIFDKMHSDFRVFLIMGSGIVIIGLELPPILKSIGGSRLKKAANLIDHIMYDSINPNGIIGATILKYMNTTLILLGNLAVFCGYINFGAFIFSRFSIADNLINNLIFLFVYQYPLVYVVSHVGNRIYQISMNKIKKPLVLNFEYLHITLKNNTYLLFLLFYLIGKSIQIDSNSSAGIVTLEAIGILYLLDTYIDKRKQCEKMKTERQESCS